MNRRQLLLASLGAGALPLSAMPGASAQQQSQSQSPQQQQQQQSPPPQPPPADAPFPVRPVRILTPFSAGSGPDAALRTLADGLGRRWGQPVTVDNRPGGNGFIAIGAFRQARPDGHELIALDTSHVCTHPSTFSRLPYDPDHDFEPVTPFLLTDFYVTVSADSPFRTLDDIVAAARARPGQVTYGSWFVGSPGHLGALRLEALTGIRMAHVPYKEMAQLYQGVANQEVQWAMGSIASAGPQERAGRLRMLAVAAPRRSGYRPDVPSADESPTTRGFESAAWVGLFAAPGTPAAVRTHIAADVADMLGTAAVQQRYQGFGYERLAEAPAPFAERIRRERVGWRTVIERSGLRLD